MTGYRKFVVAVLVILIAGILCYTGHIADGVFSTIIIADMTLFMGANVAQKLGLNTPTAKAAVT